MSVVLMPRGSSLISGVLEAVGVPVGVEENVIVELGVGVFEAVAPGDIVGVFEAETVEVMVGVEEGVEEAEGAGGGRRGAPVPPSTKRKRWKKQARGVAAPVSCFAAGEQSHTGSPTAFTMAVSAQG